MFVNNNFGSTNKFYFNLTQARERDETMVSNNRTGHWDSARSTELLANVSLGRGQKLKLLPAALVCKTGHWKRSVGDG